jgi:transposase
MMFAPSPFVPILVCHEPVNFRFGIDGLISHARNVLERDPMDGAIFVFRNRPGTSVRILFYVEDGWWLCTKRFSQGRLQVWPERDSSSATKLATIAARDLGVLLWKGRPTGAQFPPFWKKLPSGLDDTSRNVDPPAK